MYSEEEAEEVFAQVDTDGSGCVSFEEFRDWFLRWVAEAPDPSTDTL